MTEKIKNVATAIGWIVYTICMIVGLVWTLDVFKDAEEKRKEMKGEQEDEV